MAIKKKHNYLYKVTNKINNKFYIGVHSTNNIDDNYFGSGKLIKRAIKKYGKKNFKKEILEFFDTIEEMYLREAQIVNKEIVESDKTYNLIIGGIIASSEILVRNEKGEVIKINESNENVLSGKYEKLTKSEKRARKNKRRNKKRRLQRTINPDQKILVKTDSGEYLEIKRGDASFLNGDVKFISIIYDKLESTIDVKKMIKLRIEEKFSIDQLSNHFKISKRSVNRILNKHNVKLRI